MGIINLLIFTFKNINRIIKCKFILTTPKKSKYLLFDRERLHFINNYKILNNLHILDVRFESINLPVLFKTLKNSGINNLSKNYIKNYIIEINPKIIFTFTDYNPTFFLLKKLVKKITFKTIAIQSSYRPIINFRAFEKKKYTEYECDYYLFLNDFTKNNIIKKIISSRFINIGSFKNNSIKKNKTSKFDILFISQYKSHFIKDLKKVYFRELKILRWLIKISKECNYTLKVAIKSNISGKVEKLEICKKKYLKDFGFLNFSSLVGEDNKKNNYNYIDEANIVVFSDSTLGLEALARGAKILSYPPKWYSVKKKEFFWDDKFSYIKFRKTLKSIITMKKKKWENYVKNSPLKPKNDDGNKIFHKIIKKYG